MQRELSCIQGCWSMRGCSHSCMNNISESRSSDVVVGWWWGWWGDSPSSGQSLYHPFLSSSISYPPMHSPAAHGASISQAVIWLWAAVSGSLGTTPVLVDPQWSFPPIIWPFPPLGLFSHTLLFSLSFVPTDDQVTSHTVVLTPVLALIILMALIFVLTQPMIIYFLIGEYLSFIVYLAYLSLVLAWSVYSALPYTCSFI